MKIVIAPNAFKGTLTARAAAEAIAAGVRRAIPDAEIVISPVSDGGDGALDTLLDVFDGIRRSSVVSGPLGIAIEADWGIINRGRTALIEAARAFGLALVPEGRRNPAITTSRGVGDLIVIALDLGIRDFMLAIGGSANNDGGAGMASALGIRFLDFDGDELEQGGLALQRLAQIDESGRDPRIADCTFHALCDSTVPLTGQRGVSLMYSPGKGASLETSVALDNALTHYARVIRDQLGQDMERMPWAGSGGGLVGAVEVFLNARLSLGIEAVLEAMEFDSRLDGANLVVTGEGQVDEQTIYDKAPIGVARSAQRKGIPVLAICAVAGEGWEEVYDHGVDALAVVAGDRGWVRPGRIVTERLLAEASQDVFTQLVESGCLESGILRHAQRFLRSSGRIR